MSELVRGPRQVTVEFRQVGGAWLASSPQLSGLEEAGATLPEVMEVIMGRLRFWLDPEVKVIQKIIPDPGIPGQTLTWSE